MARQKIDRTGEIGYNKKGSKMIIIKYDDANNIIVEFEEGYKVESNYNTFKRGSIKNVYDRTVYGVGYIGEGKYKATDNNNKMTKQYMSWSGMMERCYGSNRHKKNKTYIGCSVAKEWHNFQVFAEWFDKKYYEIEGQKMSLDKDILIKGNKIYSPETCIFTPQRINSLFVKNDESRGNLPIGVQIRRNNRYISASKNKEIGYYDTPEEAFIAYKQYKESIIKEIANSYIDRIPEQLYNALMQYEVEIDD